MTIKVVITDLNFPNIDPELSVLSRVPADVTLHLCRTAEDVLAVAHDADGLLVQYAPITREVIAGLTRCRVMVRYGIGVDTIDVAAATEAGIVVCNVPDYCADEVSEHALALLLACARQVPQLNASVKGGNWSVTQAAPRIERVAGRCLGLVGFGAIARSVAAKAQALRLRVVAFDPYVEASAMAGLRVEKAEDLASMLRVADFVSVHAPLTPATHHLIGAEQLACMKATAYLINTSRGPLIDQEALCSALARGDIAGAALDVLEEEPPMPDNPLLCMDNVILTPHAAFYSQTSLVELQIKAAESVATVLRGGMPRSAVNRPS